MKRLFIALAVGIAVGVFFMRWTGEHRFPTEDEIGNKIHTGMTREEVIHALGQPNSEQQINAQERTAMYLPAFALLDKFEPGYMGFVVNFNDGVVRDWRILTGAPSYEPVVVGQRLFKWWLIIWPSLFVIILIVRWFLGVPIVLNQRAQMLAAFTGMNIPSRLPADFAFITHETNLREVRERAGACTRELDFAVSPDEVSNYPLLQMKNGTSAIRTLVYDLPDSDSLIILPEYPFEDASIIRAVYRWPGGAGAAD